MKELLQAIKTQLQGDANLSYVNDSDIFITPDENIIPVTANFPAIGLKDGAVVHRELVGGMWEVTLNTLIIIYQLLSAGDTSIIGQTSPRIYGVLEIAADVAASLDENLLDITGMQSAFSSSNGASETIGFEDLIIQRQTINYEYIKEEERP